MSKRTKSVALTREGIDKLANSYVDRLEPILKEFRDVMNKYNETVEIETSIHGEFKISTYTIPTKRINRTLKGVVYPTSTKP